MSQKLKSELKKAWSSLLDTPTSVDQLLLLLERVDEALSQVKQSPNKSMKEAIFPLESVLALDLFVRHSDVDVRVSVASCMSEVIRIAAPEPPYDHAKMKDVFELIVSAFEGLHDDSSRSFYKRVWILEMMAKYRSCLVMLDLKMDDLIAEMFKIFFANIRDYHPGAVFSSMGKIIARVLDQSSNISPEILAPLLACLEKGNQEFPPIAVELAERVFKRCASKIKPSLSTLALHDYIDVVTDVVTDQLGLKRKAADAEEGLPDKKSREEQFEAEQQIRTAQQFFCPRH